MNESSVQQRVRLEAARLGIELWRNNSGAGAIGDGRQIRWGLGNDSAALNEKIKSSDLIGITPRGIWNDCGERITIGVFTAVECKPEGWKFNLSDKRAVAQKAFHDIVIRAGGYAGFATCVEDFRKIVRK